MLWLVVLALLTGDVWAAPPRDLKQRALFLKMNACPANGVTRGKCPGYIIDHIKPLCAGGPDRWSNMQWQTVADAKVKGRDERRMCAKPRK
jgi:hypothetical protein